MDSAFMEMGAYTVEYPGKLSLSTPRVGVSSFTIFFHRLWVWSRMPLCGSLCNEQATKLDHGYKHQYDTSELLGRMLARCCRCKTNAREVSLVPAQSAYRE